MKRSAKTQRGGRRPGRPVRLSGTLRVLLVLGFLGALNLYVLYYRHGTSVPALLRAAEEGRQASLVPGLNGPPGTPPLLRTAKKNGKTDGREREYGRIVEVTLAAGDTVEGALQRQGVPARLAADLRDALGAAADLSPGLGPAVVPGQVLVLYYDLEDQLVALDYQKKPALGYRLDRAPAGSAEHWTATRQDRPQKVQVVAVSGTVGRDGSLYEAARRAGESGVLSSLLGDVFACDADLQAEGREGDRFRVLVEKVYQGSSFYRYGRVLAAHFEGHAGTFRAFWFAPLGQEGGYYNERGENLARLFVRSPLRLGRLPIGQDRGHLRPSTHTERSRAGASLGADYPAPLGMLTPVRALGAGKVTFHGGRGSAGNMIVVTHGPGPRPAESIYTHLSRFARGLADGQVVRTRQVIGYVGPGGQSGPASLAARPHLHLGIRLAGRLVDPLKVKAPREAPVPATQRAAFMRTVQQLQADLGPEAPAIAQSPAPRQP